MLESFFLRNDRFLRFLRSGFCCFLFAVFYFFIIVASVSKVPLDSDFANLILEAHDFINGDFFLKDRQFTGITFITTDFPYFVAGTLLFGLSPFSYVVAVSLMCFVLAIVSFVLLKVENKNLSLLSVLVFIVFSLLHGFEEISYLRSHTGAVVLCFMGIFFFYKSFFKFNRLYCILAVLFFSLALAGDMSVLVTFILPIMLIAGFKLVKNWIYDDCDNEIGWKNDKNFKMIIYCLIVVTFSIIFNKIFFLLSGSEKNSFITHEKFVPFSEYSNHIEIFIKSLLSMFDADFFGKPIFWKTSFFYFFKVVYAATGIVFIVKNCIDIFKNQEKDIVCSVLSLGFVLIFLAFLFTTICYDFGNARYYGYAPILFGIVIARNMQIIELKNVRNKFKKQIKVIIYVLLVIFAANYIRKVDFSFFTDKQVRFNNCYDIEKVELINFLEKRGLKNGYSDYWNASSVTLLSENKVTVRSIICYNGINEELGMQKWFCKNSWYSEPSNFIVISDKAETYGLTEENIIKRFGIPSEKVICGKYEIWIYDHDIRLIF